MSGAEATLGGGLGYAPGPDDDQAFAFDGVDDYVRAPALANPPTSITLEARIYCVSLATSPVVIEFNPADNSNLGVGLGLNYDGTNPLAGSVFVNLRQQGVAERKLASAGALYAASTWTHVATTYDYSSGIHRIFINGALVASTNWGSVAISNAYAIFLGARTNGPYSNVYAALRIRDARIHSEALSANELYQIAQFPREFIAVQERPRASRSALGFRGGVRDFIDLLQQSSSRKTVVAELRPALLVTGWAVHSGAAYVAGVEEIHGGITRDVTGVRTLLDAGLSRVDTLALCISTAGTFFYDPDAISSGVRWDDGSSWDDSVTTWDAYPGLYVHLEDGTSPALTSVVCYVSFWVCTGSDKLDEGMSVPDLGPDLLENGGFELGSGATATGWTPTAPAGTSIARQAEEVRGVGLWSRKYVTDGSGTAIDTAPLTGLVIGHHYRLSGAYRTDTGYFELALDDGVNRIDVDGRTWAVAVTTPSLPQTNGEWRRFTWDVIAPATTLSLGVLLQASAPGTAWLDDFSFRRIYRWHAAEPRITDAGLPALETGSSDLYFGGKRVGSGSLSLLRRAPEDPLDAAWAGLDWVGQEVRVYRGGAFADGQEVPWDDARRVFAGIAQRVQASDQVVSIDLDDLRTRVHQRLPRRKYSLFEFPTMDARAEGKPRPLLWGTVGNLTPIRIALVGSYGHYELVDTTDSPNGLKAIDTVYAYADEAAAKDKDTTRRVTLAAADWSKSVAAGTITIDRDVGPYEVEAGVSDRLDFDIGGGPLEAALTPGHYTANTLRLHIAAMLTAAAGATITCTYSESTHLWTIGKASGTLTLLLATGANKDRGAWKLLGHTGSVDSTGALSYAGAAATFTGPDTDHVLRVDAVGYKDTAGGLYTGSTNAIVKRGADVAAYIWRRHLGLPLSSIDATAMAAARAGAPQELGIYLGADTSTKDIFDRIELSSQLDLVIDGAGVLVMSVRGAAVPEPGIPAPAILERDILSFLAERSVADTYQSVRVLWGQDPSTQGYQVRATDTPSVALRAGRQETRDFSTYLVAGDDAQNLSVALGALAAAVGQRVQVRVRGRLIDRRVGQTVTITRSRGVWQPAYVAAPFRVLSLRSSYLNDETDADLVEA